MTTTNPLLEEVVEASGLMALIAPFTISRLLITAGVTPQDLTRDDLRRALPQIENGLQVYLDDDQLAQALPKLRALAGG